MLAVRRTGHSEDRIRGHGHAAGLQEFLQQRLVVLGKTLARHRLGRQKRLVQAQDDLAGFFKAAVEKNRPEDGFAGVGQNRGSRGAARFEFAFAELNEPADADFGCDFVKRLFADEVGANARQNPFGKVFVALEKRVADHAV